MKSSFIKDLEISNEEFDAINRHIKIKIKELNKYVKGRYQIANSQVTKVTYEGHKIANFLNGGDFKLNFIEAYLKILKKEIVNNDINIIEYRPSQDYNGTEDFLNWIDKQLINLDIKKEDKKLNLGSNPHPSIFEDQAFEIFTKWVTISKGKQHKEISFIFQKLKQENKLRTTNFKILSDWAVKNNYLDKDNYDKLLIAGSFDSPSKILTKSRLKIYNTIKGI